MKNELAEAEAILAAGLAGYVKAVIAIRDAELVERLQRRFKDPATVAKMKELLRE
jgi:hypothetical protein